MELTFIEYLGLCICKFMRVNCSLEVQNLLSHLFFFKEQTELLACESLTSVFLQIQEHRLKSVNFLNVTSIAIIYFLNVSFVKF